MKKAFTISVLLGILFSLTACNNDAGDVEKVEATASNKNEVKENKEDEILKDENAQKKLEEDALQVPSDEEVKRIIEKSYKLLDNAKEYFEQNQQGNHEPFLTALKKDFSESYISTLNPADFGVATSYIVPNNFEYDKHFVIQSRTADSLIVEVSQGGFDYEEIIYTIGAIKEDGEWKIDTLNYRDNETAETSLLTEDEAREIVNNYLSSSKEYEVADISVHDENTFFIQAYVYATEDHMSAVYLVMDRSTGLISKVDINDETFWN
ncbi:hypothetical protein [Mesobacillus subterraneus]|uniref:hypothetical protein n=1 Tax=Mesobacillus subterraneus TaxID=285983 RepID=UPI001CFEC0DF|nr:hypothetical protein [Mesobacillus subterraneus]